MFSAFFFISLYLKCTRIKDEVGQFLLQTPYQENFVPQLWPEILYGNKVAGFLNLKYLRNFLRYEDFLCVVKLGFHIVVSLVSI